MDFSQNEDATRSNRENNSSQLSTPNQQQSLPTQAKSPEDISTRLQKLNMKLDYLPKPSPAQNPDLPSPFSDPMQLPKRSKHEIKDTKGNKLKLNTTPDALTELGDQSYMGYKQSQSAHPGNVPANKMFQDNVHSPPRSANPANAKSAVGGQAADMHARILALQRSRSKKPTNSPLSQPSSAQVSPHNSVYSLNELKEPEFADKKHFSSVPNTASALSRQASFNNKPLRLNTQVEANEQLFKENYSPAAEEKPVNSSSDNAESPKITPASNGFDPNTVISPTAASLAASGGPISLSRSASFRTKQRSSLSARRGMNLDGSLLETNKPKLKPKGVKFQDDNLTNSPTTTEQDPKPSTDSPKGSFFKDYGKYIDIESGSLNFAGKACVHAHGIDFTSGETFNISLDKLQFISELGSGNYGTVQKVLHTPNSVFMAVKEIRLELDESSLRQIIMELDVLHRCDMKNIIAFYGAFFVEGSVYICMEYMDGGSINKIYDGGIPEKYLRYVVQSVVKGLKRLKDDFNIIHRDVKPSNILCSTSGPVKLCDFGVSGNLVASIAKTNIGCQSYMAPERIKVGVGANQQMTYTAESDIWSLGLSIIEMARGSYPYPSDSFQSIFSQLSAIVDDPSPKLDPTKYSPEACDFVSRLLDKSPLTRPKYSEIVNHPWLQIEDCTDEEMGRFVKSRIHTLAGLEGEQKK